MRSWWGLAGGLGLVIMVGVAWARSGPAAVVLRFSDRASSPSVAAAPSPPSAGLEAPVAPAGDWLQQHGWRKVWPKSLFGRGIDLAFAGSEAQRYLRLSADSTYAIWTHTLRVDPQQLPIFELTWGIERFPTGAALDLYERNDRPLAVIVSFGPKVPTPGLLPDVPRGLALFWGETETVGVTYTCVTPREGPADKPLQCTYPHIKYLALRRGAPGTIHTDRVNLLELFPLHFPDYWQAHRQVPPVVAVSFEAYANHTASQSVARLYTLAFRPQV